MLSFLQKRYLKSFLLSYIVMFLWGYFYFDKDESLLYIAVNSLFFALTFLIFDSIWISNLRSKGVTEFTKETFKNNQTRTMKTDLDLESIKDKIENEPYKKYYDFQLEDNILTFKTKLSHEMSRDRITITQNKETNEFTINSRSPWKLEADYGRNIGNLNNIEFIINNL